MLRKGNDELNIYVIAGVGTWRNFFDDFLAELRHQLNERNCRVHIEVLFPYGDIKRNMITQLHEVRYDMSFMRRAYRVGGERVAAAVHISNPAAPIVLIGHSAGGIAGYHASTRLLKLDYEIRNVVQIGSPKHPVSSALRDVVCYLYAINEQGKKSDLITRIGSWGGWVKGVPPQWHRTMHAPRYVEPIPLIGWHADYFRNGAAFTNQDGRTNLELTVHAIMHHLKHDG